MAEMKLPQGHKLTLTDRKILHLTGVDQVDGFDDETVLLRTQFGQMTVKGNNLKLKTLSPEGGIVTVEGEICGIIYTKAPVQGGFWRRLMG